MKVIQWKIPESNEKASQKFDCSIVLNNDIIQEEKTKNLLQAKDVTEKLSGITKPKSGKRGKNEPKRPTAKKTKNITRAK